MQSCNQPNKQTSKQATTHRHGDDDDNDDDDDGEDDDNDNDVVALFVAVLLVSGEPSARARWLTG